MRSLEYLKKKKEERGVSFRDMARKTGVSEAYWPTAIERGIPITLEKASQIAAVIEVDANTFVDMVFRDRLIRFLEKEGVVANRHTPNITKIIDLLKKWDPEKDDLTRYIMSTKNPLTRMEMSFILGALQGKTKQPDKGSLTSGKQRGDRKRAKKRGDGALRRSGHFSGDFVPATN
jgi:transcriptional regulator with XRE-family HTH domain